MVPHVMIAEKRPQTWHASKQRACPPFTGVAPQVRCFGLQATRIDRRQYSLQRAIYMAVARHQLRTRTSRRLVHDRLSQRLLEG